MICCPKQWGHHIDFYKMGLHFQSKRDVTYICWDHGYKRVDPENVNVVYVSRRGSVFTRYARYMRVVANCLIDNKPDVCVLKYFHGCSVIKLFIQDITYIFDVRSGSVHENLVKRKWHDGVMKLESLMFENITAISESLAMRLGLTGRCRILPLGSDVKSTVNKTFDSMSLLYVGTLNNRNIRETIHGVADFRRKYGDEIITKYTIVGDGREWNLLEEAIKFHDLGHLVELKGRVPYCELGQLFDSHNVGVSFVPITNYYECQPVGKTFDYLLSGLVVVATKTSANQEVITDHNGICVSDTSNSFAEGLWKVWSRRRRYDSREIRESAMQHTWGNILREFERYVDTVHVES